MSESGGKPSVPNGSGVDPLQRLSSFKPPRDLSLGGVKPNKKIFTPNLNVSRNKNKNSALPTVTRDKSNDRGKKDRKNDKNRNLKNGPNIIKSSGVFSEGMGVTERQHVRSSYGRDVDSVPTLQKPTLKVKGPWKIDKELEERQIKKVLGGDVNLSDDDGTTDDVRFDKDAPVRLPMSDGGWLHSKPKAVVKAKTEVIVKEEPQDGDIIRTPEVAPVEVKKETHEDTDIVSLLRAEEPALIMLQFPDTLPGRGRSGDDSAPPRRGNEPSTSNTEPTTDEKPTDDKCRLKDLEEGQIGKLLIHRSGRVRLMLGDTVFEVAAGTQASFRQEAVSVAAEDSSRSASIVALGSIPHKLNLLPHWETMLADFTI